MANEKQTGEAGRGGSGNFANDPQRASEAGKKGGEHSHGGGSQQQGGSQSEPGGSRNGSGNFANDRDKETKTSRSGPSCGPDSSGPTVPPQIVTLPTLRVPGAARREANRA